MSKQPFYKPNQNKDTVWTFYAHRSKKNPSLFFLGRSPTTHRVLTTKYLSECEGEGSLYEAEKDFEVSEPDMAAEAFDVMGFVPEKTFEVVKVEVTNAFITRVRPATAELKAYEKNTL